MIIILMLFLGAVVFELGAHLFGKWKTSRNIFATVSLISGSCAAGALIFYWPNVFSVLIALFSIYRAINMMRTVKGLMHEGYLRHATLRTSLVLLCLQLLTTAAWWAWNTWSVTGHVIWGCISVLQLMVAIALLLSVARNLRRSSWTKPTVHFSDKELPTVTIAIPARNETEDLQRCLESAVASNYPKLEILVLDDCSQTKRTPEIIKAFAHAGVRFIQGHPPTETWLPKNEAYQRLTEEASGEYLLFCGVDIRFSSDSVRLLVTDMQARHKKMLSLLPKRQESAYGHFSVIQAMRYWWELVPPRRLFNRPPVLSSCWIIETHALKKAGGFPAVARSIVPEAHFARELIKTDDYSFMRSIDGLGISSNKTTLEQYNTAVRTRYPQMHRRPENVAIVALLELFFLLIPFVLLFIGFWVSIGAFAHICAAFAALLLLAVYAVTAQSTKVNRYWFSLIAEPIAVITDLVLLHYSMWKYEFATVDWKGRNVCIPTMHVVPTLPSLERQ